MDEVITQHHRLTMLRFLVYLNPFFWFRKKMERGVAIRVSLETLGPIFVKFGQALSTRPDVLPDDIVRELSQLQDNVPPFSSDLVVQIIEKTYRKLVHEIFDEFDIQALASASIAQVHVAKLRTGEDVVVKILRPDIQRTIEKDLHLMFKLAQWIDKYIPHGKRLKPIEIVNEFRHNLMDELDFNREAANAAQLRRNFTNSPLLYIPEVYWDYIHENILVIERIDGIPVNDVAQLQAYGVNLKKLAERGLEIFFTQVFRDCFFHADMHPGNIFVSKKNPENPQYIGIDFGIIGTLNESDKYYLAENLLAFFNRDYLKVANLHIASGWVSKNTRPEDFASAIRTVCEPIFEKPLKDISFALLIVKLFQVARRFHMEVQPQLVLLQKTLLAVEGLGRQIYPDLDLWQTAKPFLEDWVREQIGPKAFLKHCQANIPFIVEELPYMPKLIKEVLLLTKNHYNHTLNPVYPDKKKSTKGYYLRKMIGLAAVSLVSVWGFYQISPKIDQHLIYAFIAGMVATFGMIELISE
jgi:ubiquinone biosynthesis protein